MSWRSEWSRHYDQIQWTVTTMLTGIIGGLIAYCYTMEVGQLDKFLVYVGFVLTLANVYYAASFRELRHHLHKQIDDKKERDFLLKPQHRLKQWPVFLFAFGFLAVAWVRLCWKHEWFYLAILFIVTIIAEYAILTIIECMRHDIDSQPNIQVHQ